VPTMILRFIISNYIARIETFLEDCLDNVYDLIRVFE